jgi:hypothetical protein
MRRHMGACGTSMGLRFGPRAGGSCGQSVCAAQQLKGWQRLHAGRMVPSPSQCRAPPSPSPHDMPFFLVLNRTFNLPPPRVNQSLKRRAFRTRPCSLSRCRAPPNLRQSAVCIVLPCISTITTHMS